MPANTIVGHITVCPGCGVEIDPLNHTRNVDSDIKYCGVDCYIEGEL